MGVMLTPQTHVPLFPSHSPLSFIVVVGQFWANMGRFAAVSNDTQHALSAMLEDVEFVDTYVRENKRRLKKSYEILTQGFEAGGMPYMPACAAMFCWLDLRQLLEEVRGMGGR